MEGIPEVINKESYKKIIDLKCVQYFLHNNVKSCTNMLQQRHRKLD